MPRNSGRIILAENFSEPHLCTFKRKHRRFTIDVNPSAVPVTVPWQASHSARSKLSAIFNVSQARQVTDLAAAASKGNC
jgi:hypothetical protein